MEQAALPTLQKASGMLIPLGAMAAKLSDVQPKYTVVFTFADKMGDLQLAKSWQPSHENGKTSFDSISQKWSRLDRETQSTSSLVDICLTDLSTSFGWAFTVEAAQVVDENRIEPALVNFAHNLSVDSQAALRQATDKPFVKFDAYVPNTVLKAVDQRITYAYGMKDFDYNVEVNRFQKAVYPERKMGMLTLSRRSSHSLRNWRYSLSMLYHPPTLWDLANRPTGSVIPSASSQVQILEPRWGVSVHRVEWDAAFAENERLSVGHKASWAAGSERWFPKGWSDPDEADTSRYFANMVGTLNKLGALLRHGGKVEDLLGGMTIG